MAGGGKSWSTADGLHDALLITSQMNILRVKNKNTMKIELMSSKHTKSCNEVAVRFDKTINDEIVRRFNNKYNGIRLSKVQNEESIFTIQVNKPNSFNEKLVGKDDIKFINEKLPEIKEEIEKEEADRKENRKRMLDTASKNTGLDLDNSEE